MLFNYISLELNAVTEQLLLVHFLTGENAAPKWFAQNYMINRWWDESRRDIFRLLGKFYLHCTPEIQEKLIK